jgi:predicted DCC family thiol-disulfide oxidoreductase YuxK
LIYRNDPGGRFLFAPVDSPRFRKDVAPHFSEKVIPDSIILLRNGKIFTRSGAALRIAAGMRFPWPVFAVFILVPPFLRDPIYDLVARNRYRWFGKRDSCFLPPPEMNERFVE